MKRRQFNDWQSVRDALEDAYKELGLEMVETEPGSRKYPDEHWNLAGLVRDHVAAQYSRLLGSCISCKTSLNFHTVIRCLDCRAPLCENCAPAHFGPSHGSRASAAHT